MEMTTGFRKFRKKEREKDPQEITFLENEEKRLRGLLDFFQNKLPNRVNYSQTDISIDKAKAEKEIIEKKILENYADPNSILHQNLKTFFDKAFFI